MTRTLTSSDFCDYRFVQNIYKNGEINKKQYRFKSEKSKLIYIVWIEFFPNDFISVKFHLKSHSHYKYKYNILTNCFEARKVIMTAIKITLDFLTINENMSVGFIGANSVTFKKIYNSKLHKSVKTPIFESKENSKRFLRYKTLIFTFVRDSDYHLIEDTSHSIFILIRKSHMKRTPDIEDKIKEYLSQHYCEIFEIHGVD